MSNPTSHTTSTTLSLPNGTNPATELQFRLDNYFAASQPPSHRLTAQAGGDPGASTEERLRKLTENVDGFVKIINKGRP